MPSWRRARPPSSWVKGRRIPRELVGRNARARVRNCDHYSHLGGVGVGFQADLAAVGRELAGVIKQSREHLGDGNGVALDREAPRHHLNLHYLLPDGGLAALAGGCGGEQSVEVAGYTARLDAAAEELGVAEDAVDDLEQALAAVPDAVHIYSLAWAERSRQPVLQQLHHA